MLLFLYRLSKQHTSCAYISIHRCIHTLHRLYMQTHTLPLHACILSNNGACVIIVYCVGERAAAAAATALITVHMHKEHRINRLDGWMDGWIYRRMAGWMGDDHRLCGCRPTKHIPNGCYTCMYNYYTYLPAYLYLYSYLSNYLPICLDEPTYLPIYIQTDIQLYKYMHAYIYVYVYIYTCLYIYT